MIRDDISIEEDNDSFLMQEPLDELDLQEITEEKVAQLAETDTEFLPSLSSFKVRVNLNMNSLQRLGEILPNLKELKLNDSIINSLRDLGTTLTNLEVLWVSRCQLTDLSGVNYFFQLKELYASFNNLKEISSLMFHNSLQVIDLEGNEITDIGNIEYLQSVPNLFSVNLIGNPVRDDPMYYEKIGEISTLRTLDEKDLDNNENGRGGDDTPEPTGEFLEEMEAVTEKQVLNTDALLEKFKKFQSQIPVNIKAIEEQAAQVFEEERKKEINDDDIITYAIKRSCQKINEEQPRAIFLDLEPMNKSKIKRPQTAMSRLNTADTMMRKTGSNFNMTSSEFNKSYVSNKTASQTMTSSFFSSSNYNYNTVQNNKNFERDSGTSSLVQGVDVAFSGNPIKALQHAKARLGNAKVFVGPKDILKLIDEFRVVVDSPNRSRKDSGKSDEVGINRQGSGISNNNKEEKNTKEENQRKIKSAMGPRENKDEKRITDMREIKEKKEIEEKNHKRLLSQKVILLLYKKQKILE